MVLRVQSEGHAVLWVVRLCLLVSCRLARRSLGVPSLNPVKAVHLQSLNSGGTVKKKLVLLSLAVLCFASLASADTFTNFPNRALQNPSDFFDNSQIAPPGTIVSTPQF